MKLFKKPKSKFYACDFTVQGRRYRASTQETKSAAGEMARSLTFPKMRTIPAETNDGPGATFSFSIPCRQEEGLT